MSRILKKDVVNRTGGVKTEDGRILFGVDAEVFLKMKAKENPNWEKSIAEWIETVSGEVLQDKNDLWESLKSGIVLCNLLNKVKANIIAKFNTKAFRGKLHPLQERENINLYLEACWTMGLASSDIFVVADLHGRQNMAAVYNNLAALSQIVPRFGIKVPPIGPKLKEQSDKPEKPIWEIEAEGLAALMEEDVDEVERQLRATTLKLEENSRQIRQLEASKQHLQNVLRLETRKLVEADNEAEELRAKGKGVDPNVARELKLERDKLLLQVQHFKSELEHDLEKKALGDEVKKIKDKIGEVKQKNPTLFSTPQNISPLASEIAKLRQKIATLEKEKGELSERKQKEEEAVNQKILQLKMEETGRKEVGKEVDVLREASRKFEEEMQQLKDELSTKLKQSESEFEQWKTEFNDEIRALREVLDEVESEKADEEEVHNSLVVDLENEIRLLRGNSSLGEHKLMAEIEQLKLERSLLEEQEKTFRDILTEKIKQTQQESEQELQKIREKIAETEAEKATLEQEWTKSTDQLNSELISARTELGEKISELQKKLEAIITEKTEMADKHLQDMAKLERENFEKENALKSQLEELQVESEIIAEEISLKAGNSSDSQKKLGAEIKKLQLELSELEAERKLVEFQNAEEKKSFTAKYVAAQEATERQLGDAKMAREKLETEYKLLEAKLESELQKEVQKRTEETEKLLEQQRSLEQEVQQLKKQQQQQTEQLQQQLQTHKQENTRSLNTLQNKVNEKEAEKSAEIDNKEKMKSQLESQIAQLKEKGKQEREALEQKLKQLLDENAALQTKQKEVETEKEALARARTEHHAIWAEELEFLKGTFKQSLDFLSRARDLLTDDIKQLNNEKSDIRKRADETEQRWAQERKLHQDRLIEQQSLKDKLEHELKNPATQTPAEKKIKDLEAKIIMTNTQAQLEVEKLKRQEELETPEYLQEEIEKMKLLLETYKAQARAVEEAKKAKVAQPSPAPVAGKPGISTAAGARGSTGPQKKKFDRKQRATVRLAPEEIPDAMEEQLANLKNKMVKIMIGEPVSYNELLDLRKIFRYDTGRRIFTFLLKEFSEKAADGNPFLIGGASFDMLKVLIEFLLNSIDLTNGADFISGKILLETSSLIGRGGKGENAEPEYIQTFIKPHMCWHNTFFWKEYFFAQMTTKFTEYFESEDAEQSEETEQKFIESEIISFSKLMYGWGDLEFGKFIIFIESLATENLNSDERKSRVIQTVQEFHLKEDKRLKAGRRKTRMFTSVTKPNESSKRQTMAFVGKPEFEAPPTKAESTPHPVQQQPPQKAPVRSTSIKAPGYTPPPLPPSNTGAAPSNTSAAPAPATATSSPAIATPPARPASVTGMAPQRPTTAPRPLSTSATPTTQQPLLPGVRNRALPRAATGGPPVPLKEEGITEEETAPQSPTTPAASTSPVKTTITISPARVPRVGAPSRPLGRSNTEGELGMTTTTTTASGGHVTSSTSFKTAPPRPVSAKPPPTRRPPPSPVVASTTTLSSASFSSSSGDGSDNPLISPFGKAVDSQTSKRRMVARSITIDENATQLLDGLLGGNRRGAPTS